MLDLYRMLLTKKFVGDSGGGEAVLINKSISANGTYNASSDSADGYKKVTVSVANTYSAADEGKVVSSGQLVAQTAHATVTQNGTYDTTLNNSVEVDVPAGGGNSFESDFLTVYKETVEVGENTVTSSAQYYTYLGSIKSIPGTIFSMSIHKKVNYTDNEWANGWPSQTYPSGYRYRNGSWTGTGWNNSSYDAVAPVGTLVDVYTYEEKNPNNA